MTTLASLLVPADRREAFLGDLIEEAGDLERPGSRRGWMAYQLLLSAPTLLWMRLRRAHVAPPARLWEEPAEMPREEAHGAFEAFLAGGPRIRWLGRGPLALTVAAHAALLLAGVVASFWTVDELSPPAVIITWSPPPAPLEKPALQKSPTGSKKSEQKPLSRRSLKPPPSPVPSRPPSTQPAVVLAEPPGPLEGSGPSSTKEGGCDSRNGACDPAGTASGLGGPSHLPPAVGARQCLRCPLPSLPPLFRRMGLSSVFLARICVDSTGEVQKVTALRALDPAVDPGILETLRTWRFAPLTLAGRPIPFCYVTRFVFETR